MLLPTRCPVCRRPGRAPCAACAAKLPPPPAGAPVPVVFAFDGVGRTLLSALKYRNGRAAVAGLGAAVARLVTNEQVDAVTWAPTSRRRRRARGYDQAELVARVVARRLGVPCVALLERLPGIPQTGRTRAERLEGPPVFRVRRRPPARVLLVDDVVTTGATLRAAARALRSAGAGHVVPVAVAATPSQAGNRAASHQVRRSLRTPVALP
jgi:predicted amidophosphoribosyltransferase